MRREYGKLCNKLVGIMFGAYCLNSCGFKVVDTGTRGVLTRFGEVQGDPYKEGFYFYNPFTSSMHQINVKERSLEKTIECFTKDTQHVRLKFIITYYPDPNKIHLIYRQFGWEWEKTIIEPAALGTIRDVIGRHIADDIVAKLEVAKMDAQAELKTNFLTRDVFLARLDFTEIDFDLEYKKAVEAKVIAIQKASESKNKTVEISERAKQQIISAEAEAKSMSIRAEALSQNKALVDWAAVEKWDGKLPTYMMGDSIPFINVKKD